MRWGVLCCALSLASAPALASSGSKYSCTSGSSSWRSLDHNLALRFPAAALACELQPAAPEAPLEPGVGPSGPGETATASVRVVWSSRLAPDLPAFARVGRPIAPELERLIAAAADSHGLDPRLLFALIETESGFQTQARSVKGALGLMQVMPATAARFGVASATELLDPETNLQAGSRYLRWLHGRFDGQISLVLAAYNAGEGAVVKYGYSVPPYKETQQYVCRILGRLAQAPDDCAAPCGRDAQGYGALRNPRCGAIR